eukprot:4463295-Pyramimonas_sp.AAC.4
MRSHTYVPGPLTILSCGSGTEPRRQRRSRGGINIRLSFSNRLNHPRAARASRTRGFIRLSSERSLPQSLNHGFA